MKKFMKLHSIWNRHCNTNIIHKNFYYKFSVWGLPVKINYFTSKPFEVLFGNLPISQTHRFRWQKRYCVFYVQYIHFNRCNFIVLKTFRNETKKNLVLCQLYSYIFLEQIKSVSWRIVIEFVWWQTALYHFAIQNLMLILSNFRLGLLLEK